MRLRRCAFIAVAGAVATSAFDVAAEDPPTPPARLSYERGPGAEQCPGEDELANAVAARLGYVPFRAGAARAVHVRIESVAKALRATLEVRAADGSLEKTRSLSSSTGDCDELGRAVALALSVAIDPMSLTRPPAPSPAPAPTTAPSEPPAQASPVEPPRPAKPPPEPPQSAKPVEDGAAGRVHLRVGVSAFVAIGAAPSAGPGGLAFVGARYGRFSLSVEGRYDGGAKADASAGGDVKAAFRGGSLVLCGHPSVLLLCPLVTLGVLDAQGEGVRDPRDASVLFGSVGARGGVELPLWGPLRLRAHADADVALARKSLDLRGATVWETPPVAALFASGLAAELP